jgi:diadenylate cyclase
MISLHIFTQLSEFTPPQWVDFSLSIVLYLFFNLFVFFFVRRKLYALTYFALSAMIILTYVYQGYSLLFITSLVSYIVAIVVFIVLNTTELKATIDNMFKFRKGDRPTIVNYDKEMIYDIIYEAVAALAKTRTGALITFERGTNLTDITRNGTLLNAPINSDLITTIFHKGTRLHDGAIIIRGSMILAASVYYTPTTKPMIVKLGSRHRAALGISEISDSVTVVVSEETGRITIAYGGELEAVYIDSFKKVLSNYMENRPQAD